MRHRESPPPLYSSFPGPTDRPTQFPRLQLKVRKGTVVLCTYTIIRGRGKNSREGGPEIVTGWGVKIWLQGGRQLHGIGRGNVWKNDRKMAKIGIF